VAAGDADRVAVQVLADHPHLTLDNVREERFMGRGPARGETGVVVDAEGAHLCSDPSDLRFRDPL
jgi:hypothetical protein